MMIAAGAGGEDGVAKGTGNGDKVPKVQKHGIMMADQSRAGMRGAGMGVGTKHKLIDGQKSRA